jgi:DNA-binding winged helix-turn-helix (wHTH) protein
MESETLSRASIAGSNSVK